MKKLSAILAGVVLFGGLSFAAPVLKQDTKAPVTKQTAKPVAKPTAKPAVKPSAKPAAKPVTKGGATQHGHDHKVPVKKTAK